MGTGVTEKVTKTFHSFLGSSSPVLLESGNLWGHHALALLGCGGDHLVW